VWLHPVCPWVAFTRRSIASDSTRRSTRRSAACALIALGSKYPLRPSRPSSRASVASCELARDEVNTPSSTVGLPASSLAVPDMLDPGTLMTMSRCDLPSALGPFSSTTSQKKAFRGTRWPALSRGESGPARSSSANDGLDVDGSPDEDPEYDVCGRAEYFDGDGGGRDMTTRKQAKTRREREGCLVGVGRGSPRTRGGRVWRPRRERASEERYVTRTLNRPTTAENDVKIETNAHATV
jgi:hypothetical protein